MPGRRGAPWGNALGGYRKQARIGGRFVSHGTAGGKINNKAYNRARRKKFVKGASITLATGAVIGVGVYAHKSGLAKRVVKSPTTRSTKRYAKAAGGALAKGVLDAKITQVGPNRYTVQRGIDTTKEIHKAIKKEQKLQKRAKPLGKATAARAKRRRDSEKLRRLLEKHGGQETKWTGDPIGGQRFATSKNPTKAALQAAYDKYLQTPAGLKSWKDQQNRIAGVKTRSRK